MARLITQQYWHEAMLSCVAPHTECPDRFIQWASFSVIGGIMKRRYFIRDGLYTLYPNQYIILISPPGIGKGTAIQFLWGLVRETGPNFLANMISDRVTFPKILDRVAKGWSTAPQVVAQQIIAGSQDHTCTIFSTELSVLLGGSEQALDFLCDSWDRNEYDYDTKTSGSAFIKDMCTSLIGATVPDFIQLIDRNKNMPVKGGFTSRCLFIFEDKPARYMLHPPPLESNPHSKALLDKLKQDLHHISTLAGGEFTYDTTARIIFDDFITRVRTNQDEDSEAVAHFKSRVRAHVLKLAMVLSISRHDTLLIEAQDMLNSCTMVEEALRTIEYVFRGAGDSDLALATARVQGYIEKVGAASPKELLTRLHRHMNRETLDRIIITLREIGYIYPEQQGSTLYYKITPNGTSPNGKVHP